MKKLSLFSAVVTFIVCVPASFAATPLTNPETSQLRPAGTVSASGATHLGDLEDKLAEKAREEGATGYVITSAGGNNQMHGTATIYK
ncbi:DUF1471 domain-containing protein [Enterobacteriaceae bacterium BIT-l23]|jgi:MqsR-controlled colanic acid and biofilm protein A|uniref:DUF1471 domain-containing protein n=1 Tax=Jejubacter calystegiae TaxID=2579935 RepID=A0A4P8YIX7_9ENTR|nr:DUF1471 family periplasmic protein McbA [Jejubacter calystegiae]NUU65170.1 DUF1471 domain-containing protein [Enterobacteriaceae bacterium BIT-l23]QCT20661.1 DUF1471 domain-containing protein [Jejubacter calystegiae]